MTRGVVGTLALAAPVRASGREAMPSVGADGSWLAPVALAAPVNTPGMELCPVVSPDGRYLFFMRSYHVYWVDAAVIEDARTRATR